MDISFPCGRDAVEAVLPHRDPFLWVSCVVSCEPGVEVTAELYVDPDLPLYVLTRTPRATEMRYRIGAAYTLSLIHI